MLWREVAACCGMAIARFRDEDVGSSTSLEKAAMISRGGLWRCSRDDLEIAKIKALRYVTFADIHPHPLFEPGIYSKQFIAIIAGKESQ